MAGARNLEPASIVDAAFKKDRATFVQAVEAPVLLVKLDTPASELAVVLREIAAQAGAKLEPTLGFETRSESMDESPRKSRRPGQIGASHVAIRVVRGLHFAVVIQKRPDAGKAFSERVSVGRARNNDVVLRAEGVSKFHAWFRCDESGTYYVGDASSRNGTRVNGEILVPNKPHRLEAGDEITFGGVETVMCPAGVLWDVIRSGV